MRTRAKKTKWVEPALVEQISKIERTLQEVRDQGQRFLMLADTLEAQVYELKRGPAKPPKPTEKWEGLTKEW